MSNNEDLNLEYSKLPWIVFKIGDFNYAINTKVVISILNLPEDITRVPNTPSYIRGVINSRSEIIPLVELRTLFSMKSILKEFEEFKDMINQRKEDHVTYSHHLR